MIEFKRESTGHPDYILLRGEMDKTYTVGEAIKEIVAKNPKNIGFIYVCGWSIRFREGSLVDDIDPYIKDFVVTEIKGTDSWGNLALIYMQKEVLSLEMIPRV